MAGEGENINVPTCRGSPPPRIIYKSAQCGSRRASPAYNVVSFKKSGKVKIPGRVTPCDKEPCRAKKTFKQKRKKKIPVRSPVRISTHVVESNKAQTLSNEMENSGRLCVFVYLFFSIDNTRTRYTTHDSRLHPPETKNKNKTTRQRLYIYNAEQKSTSRALLALLRSIRCAVESKWSCGNDRLTQVMTQERNTHQKMEARKTCERNSREQDTRHVAGHRGQALSPFYLPKYI
jgi:hypothetical protein